MLTQGNNALNDVFTALKEFAARDVTLPGAVTGMPTFTGGGLPMPIGMLNGGTDMDVSKPITLKGLQLQPINWSTPSSNPPGPQPPPNAGGTGSSGGDDGGDNGGEHKPNALPDRQRFLDSSLLGDSGSSGDAFNFEMPSSLTAPSWRDAMSGGGFGGGVNSTGAGNPDLKDPTTAALSLLQHVATSGV
jgi:hypothetical protein